MKNADEILKGKKFIRKEIEKRLDANTSLEVWLLSKKKLEDMLNKYDGLPEGVQVHTHGFIFPIAAIYLSLKAKAPEQAFEIMQYTMKEKSSKFGKSLAKMTYIPGFKKIFLSMWDSMSRKMFGEASGFKNIFYECPKGEFRMDITQCPYNKYLTEAGCPELTKLFCENDIYSYGNIPGLKFTRTKTLGTGGDCCDFKMELIRK